MTKSLSFLGLSSASVFMAFGWLLPNHYRPWTSFHSEVWVSLVFAAFVLWAISNGPSRFSLHPFERIVAFVLFVPGLQFLFGQIPYFGVAWIHTLYLLGFFLAIIAARILEGSNKNLLVDLLCTAIGIAAFFSVLLQLYQWLGLNGLGIWLADSDPNNPAANLGQRNQLATLLLWGGLAITWAWITSRICWQVSLCSILLILFGVALTGSRTAWIGIALISFSFWYWRGLWRSRFAPWVVTCVSAYFVGVVLVLKHFAAIRAVSPVDIAQIELVRAMADSRFSAWEIFIGAALEHPVFGYGWGQIAEAHLTVSDQYPPLHVVFTQSHNLFLDLVLWCGIPLGLFFSCCLLYWLFRMAQQVRSQESAVIFLFVLVVANHAMLEYPLHYAYFLLPTGFLIGSSFATDLNRSGYFVMTKTRLAFLWVLAVSMLAITATDYLKIEHSYQMLRMEWAGFYLEKSPQPPNVIALNQWHHIIKQARVIPGEGMSALELEQFRTVAFQAHKPLDLRNIAAALDLNGRSKEADLWIERLCRVSSQEVCQKTKEEIGRRRE